MRLKGHQHGLGPGLPCAPGHLDEHLPVSHVNAVERSDRNGCPGQSSSTTVGRTVEPSHSPIATSSGPASSATVPCCPAVVSMARPFLMNSLCACSIWS